jgi:RNA polymerase sigma-70 factor (ECF subfamily)
MCRNRDLADDLVQEALLKAWEARESLGSIESLRAWLFTILRNCFFSSKNKIRLEVEDIDGDLASRVAAPDSQQAHVDLAEVMAAVHALPLAQREALLLVCVEGLSYEDAAEICNCAVGTLKSRINRARERLAKSFGHIDASVEIAIDSVTKAVA